MKQFMEHYLIVFAVAALLLLSGCVLFEQPDAANDLQDSDSQPAPSGDAQTPAPVPDQPAPVPDQPAPAPADLVECAISNSRLGYQGLQRWPYHYFTITYRNVSDVTALGIETTVNNPSEYGADVVKSWQREPIGDLLPGQEAVQNYGVNVRLYQSTEMREESVVSTTLQNGTAASCNLSIPVPA